MDDEDEEDKIPERRKSKKEVMEEVIAKSKMYKAERQAAKADDDDLRMELNKGMSEVYDVLRSHKPVERTLPTPPSDTEPHMDPARAAMLAGKSREDAEKEYEANIRQMKLDARSKPTFRTKTEEEKAAEEAERLQTLERNRVRRMKGHEESSEDEADEFDAEGEQSDQDDAEAFGLNQPEVYGPRKQLDVEDEDEFVLDDDLIASGSEMDMASDDDSGNEGEAEDDGDDDFINGLVLPKNHEAFRSTTHPNSSSRNLAFTYPCPQTHEEFLTVLKGSEISHLSTIVQRIRALYHKGLAEENQAKLACFANVLVEHISYLVDEAEDARLDLVEGLIRHVHSMAKTQSHDVAATFRSHLSKIADERPLRLTAGDLMILTAISSIFPTSDHFHPVVTPAMLTIARYLGQSSVESLKDLSIGAYCCSLAVQYQYLAKRYVPEVVTYIVNAIAILSPTTMSEKFSSKPQLDEAHPVSIPIRLPERTLRIRAGSKDVVEKITFKDLLEKTPARSFDLSLLHTFIHLSSSAPRLWATKSAFPELIAPLIHALHHITTHTTSLPLNTLTLATQILQSLTTARATAISTRKPLLLHTHRPLAIKSSYPQFTDNYNPTRHYDPDRSRAELAKLRAEHKKERKGAIRELRKDANFVAREQLREKKEKDEAYDKKFKRLVAEIQGEEGAEAKEYERERRKRRGK